ncbi:MAG: hypothetical protein ABI442_09340, partial [Gemmatimonadaceae bacterium]
RMYDLAGTNQIAVGEVLVNVGQLLYAAGHSEQGRAAFAAVLATVPPARIGLHALGGFALTSSVLGDAESVAWTFAELETEVARVNSPLAGASAYCECAAALLAVGDIALAKMARARAIEIATSHGFKALLAKAVAIEVDVRPALPIPCVLTPKASVVARRIGSLQPSRRPDRVSFIAAA